VLDALCTDVADVNIILDESIDEPVSDVVIAEPVGVEVVVVVKFPSPVEC
jgi:hypothetical protein